MANFSASKVNGNSLSAAEWNQTASINNAITSSGQIPSDANLTQVGIAMARYASSTFYTDSGAADAYVLSSVGSFEAPDTYFEGMEIKFRAGNANTGASTVNVNSIGVVDLKKEDGTTALDINDILATSDSVFRHNGTAFARTNVIQEASETVKGIVELLTDAETAAGTDTTKAMTASNLASLFGTSLRSANGYIRLPVKVGGVFVEMIVQFGTQNIASNTTVDVTLPLAFPTIQLKSYATIRRAATAGDAAQCYSTELSTSQVKLTNDDSSAQDINFLSIGY